MNICAKLYWNLSTEHGDVASRDTGVNGQTDGRTDRQSESIMLSVLLLLAEAQNTRDVGWSRFSACMEFAVV